MIHRLRTYLGSRRSVMLVVALFASFLGATLYHDAGLQARGQSILFLDFPLWIRVAGWISTAIIAMVVAFWGPPRWERVGWIALAVMPFERVISYLISFGTWLEPGGDAGTPWGIAYAAQWFTAIVLLRIVATWQEDSPTRLWLTRRDQPPPMEP